MQVRALIDRGFAPDILRKMERSRSPARPFRRGSNPDYRSRAAPSCGRLEGQHREVQTTGWRYRRAESM